MEATHHGPTIEIPCCFIEIGSTKKQWNNELAGEVIAKTIYELNNFKSNEDLISVIGIGGPHYCPNFNKIQLNTNYAISHIIPSYSLPLTQSILKETEEKTKEQVKEVLIDWKACNSEQKQNITDIITKAGLKYKRTSNVEK